MANKLILIRGPSGYGKSTYARENFPGVLHLEADMWFQRGGYNWHSSGLSKAHAWCHSTADIALRQGMDVVVSNTFTTMRDIQPYLSMWGDITVYRMMQYYGNTHNVPEETIRKQLNRMVDIPDENKIWGLII